MERTGALIERLLQQYHDNEGAGKMMVTAQMLLAELQQQTQQTANTKKISVVLPKHTSFAVAVDEVLHKPKPVAEAPKPQPQVLQPVVEMPKPQPQVVPQPVIESPKAAPVPQEIAKPKVAWQFDSVIEVPTLAHQKTQKSEINETVGDKGESLNERLKANNVELGSRLQSTPVKDLKKAIGINDRYVFINELFRGDETMYERSIKTINSAGTLAEAEYWIKRELKLKLAWNEAHETVQHFDQLVKRRFS